LNAEKKHRGQGDALMMLPRPAFAQIVQLLKNPKLGALLVQHATGPFATDRTLLHWRARRRKAKR